MDRLRKKDVILPLIPLRELVAFPSAIIPILVGRPRSLDALKYSADNSGKYIFLSVQRNQISESPTMTEISRVGVIARIERTAEQANGSFRVIIQGLERAAIEEFIEENECSLVRLSVLDSIKDSNTGKSIELSGSILGMFEEYANLKKVKMQGVISKLEPTQLAEITDVISSVISIPIDAKQALLEELNVFTRAVKLLNILKKEIFRLRNEGGGRQFRRAKEDPADDIAEYRTKIKSAKLPEYVEKRAHEELDRLEMMPPFAAESTVSRYYLDWLLTIPWTKVKKETNNIKKASKILDEDHYGLEKVKDRILDYLAVRQLVKKPAGEILCFVGPPGVGKSSLSKSIARAMDRAFVRVSLGGVRDEAEIRGHRRTYIGSYPGQIIKGLKKAKCKNPVFLLDEIDKLNSDFRGDPASALLETLDPEQNIEFIDHYLDLEIDLSQVFFITTANSTDPIPPALKDRMEVIEISGYTEREKLSIAKNYLARKQAGKNGLKPGDYEINDELILEVIEKYTREAGVRNLERQIAVLMRKIARHFVDAGSITKKRKCFKMEHSHLQEFLGVPKYSRLKVLQQNEVGVALGLAWTMAGGDILIIEARGLKGKGELILTGSLGDVMKESSSTAFSYSKVKLSQLEFDLDELEHYNIHMHLPEGAVPKEGPSAGVTLAVAMISVLTGIPVKSDYAMTGEITLRGKILPVGGIKEKILAAHRYGIKNVLIPLENEKDYREDIPDDIKQDMNVQMMDNMDQLLEIILEKPIKIKNIDSKIIRPFMNAEIQ
ncbi:MAG: endopeptidase La [bacterium]|nr:endopeptidase La [bacterium]